NVMPVPGGLGTNRESVKGGHLPVAATGSDGDGDSMSARPWAVESAPAAPSGFTGARYAWTGSNAANAVFTPYLKGAYTVSFTVTDAHQAVSVPARAVVNATNAPPVANAGEAVTVK